MLKNIEFCLYDVVCNFKAPMLLSAYFRNSHYFGPQAWWIIEALLYYVPKGLQS